MDPQPFALERYFSRHEFAVRHLLCCSDCETMTVDELLALEPQAREAFGRLPLGYTESLGSPALRRAITALYTRISPDDLLVCAGAEEAIFLAMHASLEPGDHLIVHAPRYQSLAEIGRARGCEVTSWEAAEDRGWALDLDWLVDHLRPRTRLVVLNTPHNPTGWLMEPGAFRDLIGLLAKRGIPLFCDEVYRGLEARSEDRLPAACDLDERAISLGVMSKTYGLAGLRIGWVATRNPRLRQRMAELKDYTTICSSGPSEFLAEVALRHHETLAARNREIIRENLEQLDAFFVRQRQRFSWVRPRAGPIGFPRLLEGNVGRFCREVVERAEVLLAPGPLFGDAGDHLRIGFGRRSLPAALSRLEAFLDRDHPASP